MQLASACPILHSFLKPYAAQVPLPPEVHALLATMVEVCRDSCWCADCTSKCFHLPSTLMSGRRRWHRQLVSRLSLTAAGAVQQQRLSLLAALLRMTLHAHHLPGPEKRACCALAHGAVYTQSSGNAASLVAVMLCVSRACMQQMLLVLRAMQSPAPSTRNLRCASFRG